MLVFSVKSLGNGNATGYIYVYEYLAGEERVFVGMESTIDSC